MKIGFNEATALECAGQSLISDLEACDRHGFDYIEIRFDCLKEYLQEHSLEELAAWFAQHRLQPWAYNTLLFFNQRDEAGMKELDEEIDFIIEVSKAIGIKMLIAVPSFDVGPLTIGEIRDDAANVLRHIADRIAPFGMRVSLEFCGVPTCSINQFGTAYDVVMTAERDNVGVTLDTFHFHAMGSKWEDLERADGKKIFAFHINDSEDLPIGSMLDDKRLWPGDGCIDHKRTLGILKQIGFEGVATVELFRPEYYELSHDENVRTAKEKALSVLADY